MLLSLVLPVFNEEAALPRLFEAVLPLADSLACDCELIFVDDGSHDGTGRLLRAAALRDSRVKIVRFTRNFGHQAAITAGLDVVNGDAVVVMDADLQDPPGLLPDMIARFEEGFDVVSAQRISRRGDGFLKRLTARWFYRVMQWAVDERLPPEVGDFRLFSRRAVLAIREFREQHRYVRGLVAWLGLKEAIVPFHRGARVAGVTKYSIWKMLKFAWTAISSFSALPLKVSLYVAAFLLVCGLLDASYLLSRSAALGQSETGWSLFVVIQLLTTATILFAIALLGDYVARIYDEAKGRPLYVVGETINVTPPCPIPCRGVWLSRRSYDRNLDEDLRSFNGPEETVAVANLAPGCPP